MEFRLLKANEIECRVGTVSKKGDKISLLLYKDARVDMKLLDEKGVKWQREHQVINGNLYCGISIWDDEINQWVTRWDVGTESYTEKEKGEASDSFKRAGTNWGVGRELYTSGLISVNVTEKETYISGKDRNGNDKYSLSNWIKFKVDEIVYSKDRAIKYIKIVDQNNNIRFNSIPDMANDRQRKEILDLINNMRITSKDKFNEYIEEKDIDINELNVEEYALLKPLLLKRQEVK